LAHNTALLLDITATQYRL